MMYLWASYEKNCEKFLFLKKRVGSGVESGSEAGTGSRSYSQRYGSTPLLLAKFFFRRSEAVTD